MLFLQGSLQLFDGKIAIRVGVDLFKELSQVVDVLLGKLGGDVGRGEGFQLNQEMTTFEKLEKFFSLLKSNCRLRLGSCLDIQGWFRISSTVMRLSAGTRIRLMRSFTSSLRCFASGTA